MSNEAKKRAVCIVGCSDLKEQTPFDMKDQFEFWGVNNLFLTLKGPWTRWFEIHQITFEDGKWLRRGSPEFRGQPVQDYLKNIAELSCPVYMQEASHPLIPKAVKYPKDKIVAAFGDYFTNTIAWMLALAIAEEFEEIRIYGVDMAVDTEYGQQRPSCEYFLGLAVGKGIKVWTPDACDLLKTRFLYGFDELKELPFRQKLSVVKERMKKKRDLASQEAVFKQKQVDQYTGALLVADEIDKIWKNETGG